MRRGARVVQRPRACPDGLMRLSSAPSDMGFSPDGRVLAAHCDGMIWLADTELGVGEQAIILPGTADGFSVGTSVVVVAHDGRLLVYNSHAAKLVHRIRAGGEVGSLALSNDDPPHARAGWRLLSRPVVVSTRWHAVACRLR